MAKKLNVTRQAISN
nr:hypothetical protein [Lactobacillus taiwanensis]